MPVVVVIGLVGICAMLWRTRFRFTLRDWLWLVVVIALVLLWRFDRQQILTRLSKTIQESEQQKREMQQQISNAEWRRVGVEGALRSINGRDRMLIERLEQEADRAAELSRKLEEAESKLESVNALQTNGNAPESRGRGDIQLGHHPDT